MNFMGQTNRSHLFRFIIIYFLLLCCFSCKEERIEPISPPHLNFGIYRAIDGNLNIALDTSDAYTIATGDVFSIENLSTNAESFRWDFGNGTTSSEMEPTISYNLSGQYNITLTVIGKDGSESSLSKNVKVLDRVLKRVRINALNWNSNFSHSLNWSDDKQADVYVEIKKLPHGSAAKFEDGAYNGEVFYRTPPKEQVTVSGTPIEFEVEGKHVIDINGLLNHRYGFNLLAKDEKETYILSSSWGSGIGFSYEGNMPLNTFVISSTFLGNQIEFICSYE